MCAQNLTLGFGRPGKASLILLSVSIIIAITTLPVSASTSFPLSSLDNAAQEEAPVWSIYRDPFYQYGLAIPNDWGIQPTPAKSLMVAATFLNPAWSDSNFETGQILEGAVKFDIGVISREMGASREEVIYKVFENQFNKVDAVVDVEEVSGNPVKLLISMKEDPSIRDIPILVYQMPTGDFLFIEVYPVRAWETDLVKAIVNSLVLSEKEDVTIPTTLPQPIATSKDDFFLSPSYSMGEGDLLQNNGVPDSPIELYMPFGAIKSWVVGGPYGFFYGDPPTHLGNDYYATDWNRNTTCDFSVTPVAEGVVSYVVWGTSGYGYHVGVSHDLNVVTLYGHLNDITVDAGDIVSIHNQIGTVGKTGNANKICHLHLSYWVNDVASRKPSPMWTSTRYWTLGDGQSRTVSKSGTLTQAFWRGNQGWIRSAPIHDLVIQWGYASAWSGPSNISALPGNGSIQAQNDFTYRTILYQSIWRGNQGWLRSVPIVGLYPDYTQAQPWGGPISISGLPGSGDMQAADNFQIGDQVFQYFWRSNQSYSRTVPIVDGEIRYDQAGSWTGPVSLAGYPGTGDIVAMASYPVGNSWLHQSFWRGNYSYTRKVPIQNGTPNWGSADPWSAPVLLSSALPGSGTPQTHVVLPIP